MQQKYISHSSAFFAYRRQRNYDHLSLPEGVLDIVVFNQNKKFHSDDFNIHVFSGTYPRNSFIKLNKREWIASPELMFYQMAGILPFWQLVLLGLEICGSYSIYENAEFGFYNNLKPLSSRKKILTYLIKLKNLNPKVRNITKAINAAFTIEDNSASPQESRLYFLLAARHKFGGYGINWIKLNAKISLSSQSTDIAGQSIIIPDLSIKKNKIAIEYDSDTFHDNTQQNRKDKRRSTALLHEGWKVFSIVPGQMSNRNTFESIALDILKANKQETRIKTKNFWNLNSSLINNLFHSNNTVLQDFNF